PWKRLLWEPLCLPDQLRHDRVTLLHGAANALPLTWRGRRVVTILDLTVLLQPRWFNRANRAYLRWAARSAARQADRILTISESTRRDVLRLLGAPPERVVAIHCGVDARFTPRRDSAA